VSNGPTTKQQHKHSIIKTATARSHLSPFRQSYKYIRTRTTSATITTIRTATRLLPFSHPSTKSAVTTATSTTTAKIILP
jgi:hypothetical protein